MSLTLLTERLRLRDFQLGDIEAYVSLYKQQEYCQYYSDKDCDLRFQRRLANSFIKKSIKFPREDFSLAIIENASNTFCGVISLRSKQIAKATVGCGIAVLHQGQGFAEEAMRTMLDFAFTELKLECVIAETLRENQAASRLCLKLGFEEQPQTAEAEVLCDRKSLTVRYGLRQH